MMKDREFYRMMQRRAAESIVRNGVCHEVVPALDSAQAKLADKIALPWRDAGCRCRVLGDPAPHKCKRTYHSVERHGAKYVMEIRT